jgi:predicted HTH domain antitoxin
MTIELPDVKFGLQPLTGEQAKLDFAIGLYTGRHATLGGAAQVAGLPKVYFMRELGRRKVAMHYRAEDVEHDLRMAGELAGQTAGA